MVINSVIWIILLVAIVLAALITVLIRTLPQSTVMLAVTSVLLALFLYLWGMELAAVIELSVSAGLVTAILASTISLLKPTGDESETGIDKRGRFKRYVPLPIIMLLLAAALCFAPSMDVTNMVEHTFTDATTQNVLWGERALDIIGLVLLILAGVLGVVALIRRREEK